MRQLPPVESCGPGCPLYRSGVIQAWCSLADKGIIYQEDDCGPRFPSFCPLPESAPASPAPAAPVEVSREDVEKAWALGYREYHETGDFKRAIDIVIKRLRSISVKVQS